MPRTLRSPRLGLVVPPCPVSSGRPASSRRPSRGGGLQLTRAADYAIRALIHLALQPPGARLSQADIAAAIAAPAPFVGKVMQQLASAGLVTSQRGIGGGFALHASAVDATMLDAVTAIEGPLALNTCLSPDEPCQRSSFCPAHLVWHEAQMRVAEVLRAATIGALARQAEGAAACERPAGPAGAPDGREVARPVRLPVRGRSRDGAGVAARARAVGPCHP